MTKMSENKEQNLKKRPSAAMSLMPLLVLVALLTFVIRAWQRLACRCVADSPACSIGILRAHRHVEAQCAVVEF